MWGPLTWNGARFVSSIDNHTGVSVIFSVGAGISALRPLALALALTARGLGLAGRGVASSASSYEGLLEAAS